MLSWPLRGLASDGVASLSPAERAAQRELAVVRLLQGSAKAPEDLLWTAIDLLRLGLLSKETAKALCASLGITADTLEALLEAGAVAESPTVLVPASGQHAGTAVLSDMVQQAIAGAGPSARSPPIERPVFGLSSLGLQSRLAAEFVLLRKLGHGAMGSVFHARHRLDGAQYAIKIVPFFVRANGEPSAVTPEAERVLREVQALSRLNHPNVCRYHNAWVETDWASLWQGQPAAGHGAKTAPGYARLPLLLTGIASEPSADDSFSSDDGTWTQSESLSGGAGFVRRAGRGSHRDGSSDGESSFSFSPESAEHVSSFPSASLPSGSLDEVSAVDTKGMYNHNALRTPAPSVGRSWSYRKALLIQMELCEHATLHEYLSARDASLSARGNAGADGINKEESLGLLLQIVSGLEHVHACGLVHRDLKPANCCFQNGALKLLDFGLAKAHDGLEGYAHEHSGCASEAGATTSGHMPLSGSTRTVGNADRVEGYADDHDGCESGAGARVCGPEYSPRGTPMVGDGELPVLSTSADCIEQIETGSHSAAEKGMPDAAAGKSAAALSQGKRSVASAPRPAPEASCPVAATAKGVASCAGSSHPADCETAQRRPNERGRGSAGAKDRGIAGGRGTCGAAQRARVGVGTAGVGTASYSAPEQLEYGVARAHCDMFPLGLMAYELFTPFGSAMERAKHFGRLRSGDVPREFVRRWSRLSRLISRLLSASPAARPLCDVVLAELLGIKREWEHGYGNIASRSPPSSQSQCSADGHYQRGAEDTHAERPLTLLKGEGPMAAAETSSEPVIDSLAPTIDWPTADEHIVSPLLPPAGGIARAGQLTPLLSPALVGVAVPTAPGSPTTSLLRPCKVNGTHSPCRRELARPVSLVLSESLADRQRRKAAAEATEAEMARLRLELAILAGEMRSSEGSGLGEVRRHSLAGLWG